MQAFAHDAADELFSLDRGLPYTFLTLFRAPAKVVREYVEWRSPLVTKPLRYFLIVVLLVNAAASISDWIVAPAGGRSAPAALAIPANAKPGETSADRVGDAFGRAAVWLFDTHIDWVLLFTVPFLALACQRVFRAQGYNFAEFWVLALYGTAQAYVFVGLWVILVNHGLTVPGFAALALAPPTFAWICADVIDGRRWRNFAVGLYSLGLALVLLFATLIAPMIIAVAVMTRG